ncbi:disease resistance protein [Salix suchowensis]|nr:disease resistance protein [Salix suchowensis]
MICRFCPRRWASKIPISRFKWHLSGEEGRGVAICPSVNKEVQEEALKAMRGGNKRHKRTTTSINVNDRGISTCPQEQNIENENIGRVLREVQVVEVGVGEERISSYAVAGNDVVSMTGMRAQGDRVSEGPLERRLLTEPVDRALEQSNLAGKAGRTQVGVQGTEQGVGEERIQSHSQAENAMEDTGEGSFGHDAFQTIPRTEQVQHLEIGSSCERPSINQADEPRGDPSQPKDPLCLDLGDSSSRILKDNTMGQAFEENRDVIWSLLRDDEVSTIGIYGMRGVGKTTLLQHIYNELLERPDICDHVWWLRQKQKWILILDDLWNNFEPHEVGIHSLLKGCKLILTTRSRMVCARIACQYMIKVTSLSEGEAWTLFMEQLGHDMAISLEIEGIAKDIARECAGLQLGIITIASSLRGVDDLPEWRTTLKKLRELKFRDMDEKVFKVLRVSYDQLDAGLALKQCLLYCALFPKDHMIEREELIDYLIDEGIIKGMRSRQDAFDKGHMMLNRLQYVCLLESAHDRRCVKINDMIRDMAIQIMQENSQVIVKAGAQLEELPDTEEWMENLTIVSLMQNRFKEIPPSHSPMCPNLSTLLLCQNHRLRFIADSFFKQFHGLRVLNLDGIENLPDSVSDLVSLTALLLIHCWRLRYVPSLKKLRGLKRLDLFETRLEKMPQGMKCLSNLRYLRMNGCGEKEFPSGILPKLSYLQVFVLDNSIVKGKEVGSLRNLETLECNFEGVSDFVEYLRYQNGIQSLRTCKIFVGTTYEWYFNYLPSKTVLLGNCNINADRDFEVKFLNGIQGLHCESIDARSLCDVLSLENATELEIISIENCDSMKTLVSSSWFCSATLPLPSHNGMFSRLKKFHCVACNSMEKLFPLELLSYLVNLEMIIVSDYEESNTSNPIAELTLPQLTTLELFELPELKGICSAKLICNSLEDIVVRNCEKLKRMAISLPLLEIGQPSPHPSLKRIDACPKEWWETVVEWEPPNAKEVLRPIVRFDGEE